MKTLTECIREAMQACTDAGFQATTDNVTSMACTLYIQGSKGKSGGGYRSGGNRTPNVPKEQQRGAPPGQVMQVGAQCGHCYKSLKQSKGGNAYCPCWYEADPYKLPQQAPPANPNNY